ncbi:MAG TPA: PEP-CTERM sorting domain-containing protein [Rhodocyclaceae bacterium]|jgi:hypothetical protein|nr:PEP-CTERM sorting domain-containing protein [Rhodocyclaceae bacterium]
MRNIIARLIAACITVAGLIAPAAAVPITYDFTATGFTPVQSTPVPQAFISGSVTLDGSVVSAINLTIGSHVYNVAEMGVTPLSGNLVLVGGLAAGVNTIVWGTDDFGLIFRTNNPSPAFKSFGYSMAGVNDFFQANSITVKIHQAAVPEPGTLALIAAACMAAALTRRKKVG